MAETRTKQHSIEKLVEKTGSKFLLASLVGKRTRQIVEYRRGAGMNDPSAIPPLVGDITDTPMSIAMQEIETGKIIPGEIKEPEPVEDTIDIEEIATSVSEEDIAAIFGTPLKEGEDIFSD